MLMTLLLKVCQSTPPTGGIIVFLQSYGYKQTFMTKLKGSKEYQDVIATRTIFEEVKDSIEDVFGAY